MPDYRRIYEVDAERYHQLVTAEDAAGELPRTLRRVVQLEGARVVEIGMGTGRVTRLLLDAGASVIGYDQSAAMIAVAKRTLGDQFVGIVADIRETTLPTASANVAIAAWALGHFCEWYAENWQREVDGALRRMWDAVEVGGALLVLETLGTGSEVPGAPNADLGAYYQFLEQNWGMQRDQFRTDYRFTSMEAALDSIGFFFGPELEQRVRERGWLVVPEWTGLWWKKK